MPLLADDSEYDYRPGNAWRDYALLRARDLVTGVPFAVPLDVLELNQNGTELKRWRILQISYMNSAPRDYNSKQEFSEVNPTGNAALKQNGVNAKGDPTYELDRKQGNPALAAFNAILTLAQAQASRSDGVPPWVQHLRQHLEEVLEPTTYTTPGKTTDGARWAAGDVFNDNGQPRAAAAWYALSSCVFTLGGGSPQQMGAAVSVLLFGLYHRHPSWNKAMARCLTFMRKCLDHPAVPTSAEAATTMLKGAGNWTCTFSVLTPRGTIDRLLERCTADASGTASSDPSTAPRAIELTPDEKVSIAKDFVGCFMGLMCSGFVGVVARQYLWDAELEAIDIPHIEDKPGPTDAVGPNDRYERWYVWNRGPGCDAATTGHLDANTARYRSGVAAVRSGDAVTYVPSGTTRFPHVMTVDIPNEFANRNKAELLGGKLWCYLYEASGDPKYGGLVCAVACLTVIQDTKPAQFNLSRRGKEPARASFCCKMDHFFKLTYQPPGGGKRKINLCLEFASAPNESTGQEFWGGANRPDCDNPEAKEFLRTIFKAYKKRQQRPSGS